MAAQSATTGQVLEFQLGSETYCVSIDYVTEIVDIGELTSVPNAPPHVRGVYDLTYEGNYDADPNGNEFSVSEIQDDDGSISGSQVLNDPSDRATIIFSAESIRGSGVGDGLGEGETATVRLNTQSGGTTTARLVVPETLSGNSAVSL